MRLVLILGLVVLAGCSQSRLSDPYTAVSVEASVVTTPEAAVDLVIASLPDPAAYEPDPIQVTESPGQWMVSLRYAQEQGTVQTPDRTIFRVSKATGEVDIPLMLR